MDFTILNSNINRYYSFEISPTSSHMYTSTPYESHESKNELKGKWNKEMSKRNEYLYDFDICTITFTDTHLKDIQNCFNKILEYINKSNNNIIEFNDNSYVVINQDKNIYEFYAAETGDYEVEARDQIELINIIKTYMVNKYNMDDLEVENNSIFKNDILAYTPPTEEKEIIKPIAATQESKKVVNVVKKETNNNTIKNEVIEEPATEEAEHRGFR